MTRTTQRIWQHTLISCIMLSMPFMAAHAEDALPSPTSKAAFDALVKRTYPLSRDQVHQFKTIAAKQEEAKQAPIGNAPAKGHSSIVMVSLKPDQDMPVVRIAPGRVSSLFFTDKAGKPWPIKSYVVGDPNAFHIMSNIGSSTAKGATKSTSETSVLVIQGHALYGQTNMAIMMKGLDVPVMINLVLSPKVYDYLDYLRIQAYPIWDQGLDQTSVSQAPSYMTALLSGIPPAGATPLKTQGDNGQTRVWAYDGEYLMLTPATLLSPAWGAKMDGTPANPSSVGLHAYKLPASPVIRLSSPNGAQQTITVQDV